MVKMSDEVKMFRDEVVSVYFNVINNDYQQNSRVLYTFIRNK